MTTHLATLLYSFAHSDSAGFGAARSLALRFASLLASQGGTGVCRVQFSVRAEVGVGFSLRIAGNHASMGSWDVARAVPLAYVSGRWVANLQLPCGRVFEYKYVVVRDNGSLVSWQPGADSVLSVFREDSFLQVEDHWSGDPVRASESCLTSDNESCLASEFSAFPLTTHNPFRVLADALVCDGCEPGAERRCAHGRSPGEAADDSRRAHESD